MVHSSRLLLFIFFASLVTLTSAIDQKLVIPDGDTFVSASDSRISYDPPLDSSQTVWSQFAFDLGNGSVTTNMETSDSEASFFLLIPGNSIKLYIVILPGLSALSINLDETQTVQTANTNDLKERDVATLPINAVLSSSHTVVIRKAADSDANSTWNVLGISFTPLFNDSVSSIVSTSPTTTSIASSSSALPPHTTESPTTPRVGPSQGSTHKSSIVAAAAGGLSV